MNKDELDMESLLGYGLEMLVESGKYDVRERLRSWDADLYHEVLRWMKKKLFMLCMSFGIRRRRRRR